MLLIRRYNNMCAGCEAVKCGRMVFDRLVTAEEAKQLIAIAEKGMALGGGSGGVRFVICN